MSSSTSAAEAEPGHLLPSRSADVAVDSGRRGRLEISSRVVERIAEVAARQVDAGVRQAATFGRGLPGASAEVAGRHGRMGGDGGGRWGRALPGGGGAVRVAGGGNGP